MQDFIDEVTARSSSRKRLTNAARAPNPKYKWQKHKKKQQQGSGATLPLPEAHTEAFFEGSSQGLGMSELESWTPPSGALNKGNFS
jgi:hypothetical protein